jgi:hypothetical protein
MVESALNRAFRADGLDRSAEEPSAQVRRVPSRAGREVGALTTTAIGVRESACQ